jgi:3-deoxy-manno-octulosonate cytidylyltransferase (CMP-KDO synthetase)
MKILGVIPARYASTRFPGKPLADLRGKTMIQRVYEQCKKATRLTDVVVATDHPKILETVTAFGGSVCLTAEHHPSGTDRCHEAWQKQDGHYDYVINIQGDEPFIAPEQIDLLASILDGDAELATLIKAISHPEVIVNPNVVKVVVNQMGEALYFSRSPIPHVRGSAPNEWLGKHIFYKHIGMYGYRTDVLTKITRLPVSTLERAESLEQLRWLENGYRIKTAVTDLETVGIDTPEDLAEAVRQLQKSS